MNQKDTINFILAGVGGQGTILASDLLAAVGMEAGFDVKQAEVHGMAQRGGSVSSHVRWGPVVYSPLIPVGGADILVGFEQVEAVRYAHFLRTGGVMLVNQQAIAPITVSAGSSIYPSMDYLRTVVARDRPGALGFGARYCPNDGQRQSRQCGHAGSAVCLIGGTGARLVEDHREPGAQPLSAVEPPGVSAWARGALGRGDSGYG